MLTLNQMISVGRNVLHITLAVGKFAQDGKKSAKNVEIKITVQDNAANEVPCLTYGIGVCYIKVSSVYRHGRPPRCDSGTWVSKTPFEEEGHAPQCTHSIWTCALSIILCQLLLQGQCSCTIIPTGSSELPGWMILLSWKWTPCSFEAGLILIVY
jgi:hypothetical protein